MYLSDNWNQMFEEGAGSKHEVVPVTTGNEAEVLEVSGRPRDKYGEAYQDDDECYIIFRVGDRFFKKTGYESSYGDEERSWNGPVTEVFGETKTVTVFVPKKEKKTYGNYGY